MEEITRMLDAMNLLISAYEANLIEQELFHREMKSLNLKLYKGVNELLNPSPLKDEIFYFESLLKDLLIICPNKYVLIKGQEMIGAYDTREEALYQGVKRYTLEPFLIRQVLEKQPVYFVGEVKTHV